MNVGWGRHIYPCIEIESKGKVNGDMKIVVLCRYEKRENIFLFVLHLLCALHYLLSDNVHCSLFKLC